MKRTNRTMTLSGMMEGGQMGGDMHRFTKVILEYSNVLDINRAWRVKDFKFWLASNVNEIGFTDDAIFNLDVQLSTDEMTGPIRDGYWNAGDNRAIGWGFKTYSAYNYPYKHAGYTPAGICCRFTEEILTEDHIIQNYLQIAASVKGGGVGTENKPYNVNYIVELEEWDITPVESIVFNIKSKAQDIEN